FLFGLAPRLLFGFAPRLFFRLAPGLLFRLAPGLLFRLAPRLLFRFALLARLRLAPRQLVRLPAVLLLELAQLFGFRARGIRAVRAARGARVHSARGLRSGPRAGVLAQLGDLALGKARIGAARELLHVELEILGVVAVLDRAPELDLDFLRPAAGAGRGGERGLRRGALRGRLRRRLRTGPRVGPHDGAVLFLLGGLAFEHALQRAAEVAGALVARLGRLGERTADHAVELRRERCVELRGPHRVLVHD